MFLQGFAIVPFIALFMYLFEFSTLLAAKKNSLVNTYLFMLVFLIMWSGGSFLMRVEFFGLVAPWFHLSLVGIWLGCLTLDELLARFAGKHMTMFWPWFSF